MLWIRDILVRIRIQIRGSVLLTSESCSFGQWLWLWVNLGPPPPLDAESRHIQYIAILREKDREREGGIMLHMKLFM